MYGLDEEDIQRIISVIKPFKTIEQVVLYGSRAKGNFKPYSDIDLTLKGNKVSPDTELTIAGRLDDLLLPYKIDLSIYHLIRNKDLVDHINRIGISLYKRN
ncbi:nucleotidyltransferase domain-containing protein [Aquimarina sp. ERC-38]|uniref:nucleotidyltransferase domain-containing protein n=1 Tax=Aquimarina sp. ERC-38 TaxID=2949996 RepID=UPI00224590B6|nr:nucleotidyltransferase domain-containing protein [Aquimarina sp. ERC-38]UZO79793.1 nucleotidyltransferase domain-containing protein [Aquimarina sp. ERC-38]